MKFFLKFIEIYMKAQKNFRAQRADWQRCARHQGALGADMADEAKHEPLECSTIDATRDHFMGLENFCQASFFTNQSPDQLISSDSCQFVMGESRLSNSET